MLFRYYFFSFCTPCVQWQKCHELGFYHLGHISQRNQRNNGDSHFSVDTRRFGNIYLRTLSLFLFLLWCLLYFYREFWALVYIFFIWIVSGILTFIIGKPGWHIGASSIIYSLAFFLFFSGILRKHVPLVALSLLVTFLYGSLVWNMFPQFASSTTSWEGHFGGRSGRNSRSYIVQTQRPSTTGTFH